MPSHQLVSVFVSSVFRDMHRERDLLNRLVFPEVQEALRARGYAITVHGVDLRWGLDTSRISESERELEILQVCLEEIEAAKPFFLCMLGQVYGTEASKPAIDSLTREHRIELQSTDSSITTIEIEFALRLAAQNAVRPLFLLREPGGTAPDDPRMAVQKQLICDRFADSAWRYDSQDLSGDGEVWAAGTAKILLEWIEPQLPKPSAQALDRTGEYREAFEVFRSEVASTFIGRDELLQAMASEMIGATADSDRLRVLRAGAGEGKTSLAVRLIEHLQSLDVVVLGHIAGLRPDGASADAMLRRFCDELCDSFGQARMTDEVWRNQRPADVFGLLLERAAAERTIVCVLDTIEEMEPGPAGRLVTWWPRKIAGRAALLVTCRDAADLIEVWSVAKERIARIPEFTMTEARQLAVTLCDSRRRRLSGAVLDAVLSRTTRADRPAYSNPLWVRLLIEELNLLEGRDFVAALSLAEGGSDYTERLLLAAVKETPGDANALIGYVFDRMEGTFGRERMERFAGLLALSRSGLRPSDISRLWIGPKTPSPLELSQLRHRLRAQVSTSGPSGVWRWQHETGRRVTLDRYLFETGKKEQLHSEIANHLLSLPAFDVLRLSEAPHHLAAAGRIIDLARMAAREVGPETAGAFLELLGPEGPRGFDLAAVVASPELVGSDAREFAVFLSSVVHQRAERSWPVAPTIAILEQTADGLERRRDLDGPAEETELDRILVVIENELFERLRRAQRQAPAARYIERALTRIEQIVASEPGSVHAIASLAHALERAGHAALARDDFDTALARAERCVETCRRLVLLDKAPHRRMQLASSLTWLGIVHKQRGELTRALTYLEEALSECRVAQAVTRAVEPIFASFHRDNLMHILEFLVDVSSRRSEPASSGSDAWVPAEYVRQTARLYAINRRHRAFGRCFVGTR